MKLYPILYEAAQSVEGSLGKGIAAFAVPGAIVLVSTRRVLESLRGRIKKAGVPSYLKPKKTIPPPEEDTDIEGDEEEDDWDERSNFEDKLGYSLSSNALVGSVSYHGTGPEVYKVDTSAGVNKFGPLAYQLVMNAIKPAWIQSDSSLKEASQGVWNKMYQLSNGGAYERKWLGEFNNGEDRIKRALYVNGNTENYMSGYLSMIKDYNHMIDINASLIEPEELPPNPYKEEVFLKFLEENPSTLPFSGQLWAYRLTNPDPKIQELFDSGNDLLETMQTDYGIPKKMALGLITDAADKFFSRLYRSNH
jgi:hypothetical protein